jgi:acetyl esterase
VAIVTRPAPTTDWVSQLFGRPVSLPPRTSVDQIPAARAFWDLAHLNEDLPALGEVHERVVLRERDGVALTAEVYVPQGQGPFPTMLYLHGGSWVLWSAAHLRKVAMGIAAQGVLVANLDYGLAPEHPFPWAVEDAVYAARWLTRHADRYGGRPSGLLIGGDSAGANLAAAAIVALNASAPLVDGGALADTPVTFAGAFLAYGIFDFPLLFAEPGRNAAGGVIETTWNLAYLGPNFIKHHRAPIVSPLYAPNLATFPPAYLCCGDRDALLPQSLAMTKALVQASVPTTLSVVEGGDHAFLMIPDVIPGAGPELQRIHAWLRQKGKR